MAFEYYNDSDWAKAAPLFLEMYTSNKANSYLNYYVRCLIELEDYQTAEKELRKAQRQSKDIGIYVDLAYLYDIQKDRKKSDEFLEKPFKNFPQTIAEIKNLGYRYSSYRNFEHALRVYLIGRSVLNRPEEFRMDVAQIFAMQHRHSEMLDEYLAMLLAQPAFLNSVENYLFSALTRDIDENLLDLTQQKTLAYIQRFPGLNVFSELLIWVYIQQNEYELAVDQAISVDIRSRNNGMRTLSLARSARQGGDYLSAIRAYEHIIEHGASAINPTQNTGRPTQNPYYQALVERNQSQLQKLEEHSSSTRADYQTLFNNYQSAVVLLPDLLQKASLIKDMAYLSAYYLSDPGAALFQIDSALALSTNNREFHSICKLDKADYLMTSGDPWSATFLYAQVDKENKNNPTGSLAKFRKAQLAYFTGDFDWSLAQLNVLKASSSKLVANDAFELSLLIRDNQSIEDSSNLSLNSISRAEYLIFQKKISEGIMVLDSIIETSPSSLVKDDALFRKAEILLHNNNHEDARSLLEQLIKDYKYDLWGHKAMYLLGELLFEKSEYTEAEDLFGKLVEEFPNSFYNLDARNYLRKIKDKLSAEKTQ